MRYQETELVFRLPEGVTPRQLAHAYVLHAFETEGAMLFNTEVSEPYVDEDNERVVKAIYIPFKVALLLGLVQKEMERLVNEHNAG